MPLEMSRSEQKRRMKELEKLVGELAALPSALLDELPCSREARDLLREAASMKGGTRVRHLKYITRLLKDQPVGELYSFLSERKGRALQEKKEFHEAEYLRDALLNEAIERRRLAKEENEELEENWSSEIAAKIGEDFPGIDKRLLTRLAWLYAKTRNRKHSRELFRIIRAAREQDRLFQQQQ